MFVLGVEDQRPRSWLLQPGQEIGSAESALHHDNQPWPLTQS